ncbi:MAG: septum formation family protein [Actinomycetota bacterium]
MHDGGDPTDDQRYVDGSLPPPPPRPPAADARPVGAPPAPKTGWRRIPFWVFIVVLLVIGVGVVAWMFRDRQAADDLAVGDCFDYPDEELIFFVTSKGCDEPHDAEVLAIVEVQDVLVRPMESPSTVAAIEDACSAVLETLDLNVNGLPEDAVFSYFFPDDDEWAKGDRRITCLIESENGLLRPVQTR